MKVLIWGQNPRLPSGMAKVGDYLARELSKYHDVVYQAQTGMEYGEEYNGYRLYGDHKSNIGDTGIQQLKETIKGENPDVVLTNLNWHQLTNLPNVMNLFRNELSTPVFLHTAVESEEPVPNMHDYIIDNHVNDVYFIPYTEAHYDMWQDTDMGDFVPDYAPHGVDHRVYGETTNHNKFYKRNVGIDTEENTVFLFVGENWRRKRMDLMLKAFKEFKERNDAEDAKMVLHSSINPSHGDGLFYTGWDLAQGELTPLLDSVGLENGEDVFLTKRDPSDKIPEEQMPLLYNGADALVLPTMAEGFGLPLVEAGACGTPALVTDTSVTREVCSDGALYFDTSQVNYLRKGETLYEPSVESMKEKFEEFYHMSEAERNSLSGEAVENARGYRWREVAGKFDDLFEMYEAGELPTKRANEAKKIGEDIDVDLDGLTE